MSRQSKVPPPPPRIDGQEVTRRAEMWKQRRESSGVGYRPDDFEHSVRVDGLGNILGGHGQLEELAALAAYVCRVSDLIGEFLGLGGLVAFDASQHAGACLIYRDAGGDVLAVKPRAGLDLRALKIQLNL